MKTRDGRRETRRARKVKSSRNAVHRANGGAIAWGPPGQCENRTRLILQHRRRLLEHRRRAPRDAQKVLQQVIELIRVRGGTVAVAARVAQRAQTRLVLRVDLREAVRRRRRGGVRGAVARVSTPGLRTVRRQTARVRVGTQAHDVAAAELVDVVERVMSGARLLLRRRDAADAVAEERRRAERLPGKDERALSHHALVRVEGLRRANVGGIILPRVFERIDPRVDVAHERAVVLSRVVDDDASSVLVAPGHRRQLREKHVVRDVFLHLQNFHPRLQAVLLRHLRSLLQHPHVLVLRLHRAHELRVFLLQLHAQRAELARARGGGAARGQVPGWRRAVRRRRVRVGAAAGAVRGSVVFVVRVSARRAARGLVRAVLLLTLREIERLLLRARPLLRLEAFVLLFLLERRAKSLLLSLESPLLLQIFLRLALLLRLLLPSLLLDLLLERVRELVPLAVFRRELPRVHVPDLAVPEPALDHQVPDVIRRGSPRGPRVVVVIRRRHPGVQLPLVVVISQVFQVRHDVPALVAHRRAAAAFPPRIVPRDLSTLSSVPLEAFALLPLFRLRFQPDLLVQLALVRRLLLPRGALLLLLERPGLPAGEAAAAAAAKIIRERRPLRLPSSSSSSSSSPLVVPLHRVRRLLDVLRRRLRMPALPVVHRDPVRVHGSIDAVLEPVAHVPEGHSIQSDVGVEFIGVS
eukprot:29939-Pelagococcus_subviridis.AAC.1